MTVEDIRNICLKLKGVTEDIKWGDHLCFNIGGKMFMVTAPSSVPVSASFKTSDEDFEELGVKPGFKPAPYMARHKWIYTEDIGLLGAKDWKRYITSAYTIVSSGLPAKTRKALGI
jgi:predicted DNA-binding protein (MmcQ/YjbR family)